MLDNREAVSTAIKERLRVLKTTPEQLVTLSGVAAATVRQILNQPEKRRPTRRTLRDISVTLRWPENFLYNILNGVPQETAELTTDDPARPSSLESRMSMQEQRLHKLTVILDQRLGGDIVEAIYKTSSGAEIPPDIQDRRDS